MSSFTLVQKIVEMKTNKGITLCAVVTVNEDTCRGNSNWTRGRNNDEYLMVLSFLEMFKSSRRRDKTINPPTGQRASTGIRPFQFLFKARTIALVNSNQWVGFLRQKPVGRLTVRTERTEDVRVFLGALLPGVFENYTAPSLLEILSESRWRRHTNKNAKTSPGTAQ